MVVGVDGRRSRIAFVFQSVIQALVEFSVESNKAVTQLFGRIQRSLIVRYVSLNFTCVVSDRKLLKWDSTHILH